MKKLQFTNRRIIIKSQDHKKEFQDIFDSLCSNHTRFAVWSDFVHLSAYSINGTINFKQDREDAYLKIKEKYSEAEMLKFSQLLRLIVEAYEDDREQDFLGQLYMENKFGDVKKGQYFTPYSIASLMSNIKDDEVNENTGYTSVNDPCCGTGAMLIAYTNEILKSGRNPQTDTLIVASDIDPCIALMCYIQLSLLGLAGYVCIRDTIAAPITGNILIPPEDAYIMPMFIRPIWTKRRIKIR